MVKKILITGPESSGKSSLCKTLASHYQAPYTLEYARAYLNQLGKPYTVEDLDAILKGQLDSEDLLTEKRPVPQFIFCDTGPVVMYIWSEFRFQQVSDYIREAAQNCSYDLILLLKPNLTWEPDPLRESPDQAERDQIFELFKKTLENFDLQYTVIDQLGKNRVQQAKGYLAHFLQQAD